MDTTQNTTNPATMAKALDLPMKGFSYGFMATRGQYRAPAAFESLARLRATGTEWIAFCLTVTQERYNSTEIRFDYNRTPTDLEILEVLAEARRLGFRICFKPIINCNDHVWRARISFPGEGGYWQRWFAEYRGFLVHYAELAARAGCELFCLGCEMLGTEHREEDWRATAAAVRAVFPGKLTYNTNHGKEEQVAWWDAVDILGTSAYFPVADGPGASKEAMMARWLPVRDRLAAMSRRYDRPVAFMEVGIRSAAGCAAMPWDFTHRDLPHDEDEQANFYAACLETFRHEDWFAGWFWWDWTARLYPLAAAGSDNGFGIHGKKAEQVLASYYRA